MRFGSTSENCLENTIFLAVDQLKYCDNNEGNWENNSVFVIDAERFVV